MPSGVYKRTEYHRKITSGGVKRSMTPLHRKKLSELRKGKKQTNETKEKISKANKISVKKGENSPNWKRDSVAYTTIHKRMITKYGQPRYCEHCKRTDKKNYEWCNKDHKYLMKKENWMRLCVPCHTKYDINYNNRPNNY